MPPVDKEKYIIFINYAFSVWYLYFNLRLLCQDLTGF